VGSAEVEHGGGGKGGRHRSKLWTRHGSFAVWHARRENSRWAGWASGQTKTNPINFSILSKHSNLQIVKMGISKAPKFSKLDKLIGKCKLNKFFLFNF
jgi:hypothetical protein